jgi:hypothetical protein
MALEGALVTVGTTATRLSDVTFSDNINYNYRGQSILVQNPSTTITVYLGGTDVTSSVYGYRLLPNQSISIDLYPDEQLYAAVASSTQVVSVIRTGV